MSLVNLYRSVKEVEEGKWKTIVVHPPSVVNDIVTYAMRNDPMRVFQICCVRLEKNEVLQLNQIWSEFKKFKDRYYKYNEIFAGLQESQVSSWLRENICGPEMKTRGRYVGVTGYSDYRLATTTEEESYKIKMQAVDDGLHLPSSVPPSELLFGPPALPHYALIYVPESPVYDSHYRFALPPERPFASAHVPEHGDTGPFEMEMEYEMHMEYERHLDMIREEEMMRATHEEGGSSEASDEGGTCGACDEGGIGKTAHT